MISADMKKPPLIIMAAALKENGGIGYNNALPWNIPGDWKYFEETTTKSYGDVVFDNVRSSTDWNNIVIMGRRTFEAHPMLGVPLANRYNIIISGNKDYNVGVSSNVELTTSLEEAIARAYALSKDDGYIFILGGEEIYRQSLLLPECTHLLITEIHSSTRILCDRFIPEIDPKVFRLAQHEELKTFLKDKNIPFGRQKYQHFEYEFVLYIRK
ncbi:dihydrofolate reductase-like domain-containing protein [Mycotypha africana]|uniref:dihydrofolate reductase-like domain-containing protein n=1 Tax=Mycotypha africana TaxID=64632 RepID=UPI0023000814|nr:dihydrofolate reductase-like domain-containing protein [Mycotypha africana]KAI8982126.1 dihydrofolate reductase-like domain-containing protein [Mycotypha africana]